MAFSKTRFGRYDRMENKMARRKMLRKVKIGRNLETFGTQYNKQKETRKLANLPMRGGSYVGHKDKRNTT